MRSVLLAVNEPIKICDVPYHFAKACLPDDETEGIEAVEILGKTEHNKHTGVWLPLNSEDSALLARIWDGLPQPNEISPEDFSLLHITSFESSPERPSWDLRWSPTRAPSIDARKSFQDRIEKDIRDGVLVLRAPVTLIPVAISDAYRFGFYVRTSFVVTFADLKKYAKKFEISVTDSIAKTFAERRSTIQRMAVQSQVMNCRRIDMLSPIPDASEAVNAEYQAIIEQQKLEKTRAGRYTLEEAAKLIADAIGERYEELLQKLVRAVEAGALTMYEPGKLQKYEYKRTNGTQILVRTFYEEAHSVDLNKWLVQKEPRLFEAFQFPESHDVEKTEQVPPDARRQSSANVLSKEEADALRRCVQILAPSSTPQERSQMALNVEAWAREKAPLVAFHLEQVATLFYPGDPVKAADFLERLTAAYSCGDLPTALPKGERAVFVSDLAAWPDCPPVSADSPLKCWLPVESQSQQLSSASHDSMVRAELPPHKKGGRTHVLAHLIVKAQKGATDTWSNQEVWAKLCGFASAASPEHPLHSVTESGIKYYAPEKEDDNGFGYFTKRALGEYLRRKKNAR